MAEGKVSKGERITRAELARRRGVSRSAITRAVKAGRISLGDDGLVDADEAAADMEATAQRVHVRHAGRATRGLNVALAAGATYSAQLRKLDYEKRVGELSRTEDVLAAMGRCAEVMVREINRLPDHAEALAAVIDARGIEGLRAALKSVSRDLRQRIADRMNAS